MPTFSNCFMGETSNSLPDASQVQNYSALGGRQGREDKDVSLKVSGAKVARSDLARDAKEASVASDRRGGEL